MAALLRLYNGTQVQAGAMLCHRGAAAYSIKDEEAALQFLAAHQGQIHAILSNTALWGMDLTEIPDFAQTVQTLYDKISSDGVKACLQAVQA